LLFDLIEEADGIRPPSMLVLPRFCLIGTLLITDSRLFSLPGRPGLRLSSPDPDVVMIPLLGGSNTSIFLGRPRLRTGVSGEEDEVTSS
jgi:hypothetical protein